MKKTHALLLSSLLIAMSAPAFAQPIESEPLKPFVPYTLKNETDPMALGSAPTSDAPSVSTHQSGGFAPMVTDETSTIQAPPPPAETVEVAPYTPPVPAGELPPQPSTSGAHVPAISNYDNNVVTGLTPRDESKFENRQFCTLKVSFASIKSSFDDKTDLAVKGYLEDNKNLLTYVTAKESNGHAYCITVEQHNNKAKIYNGLKNLIPPKGQMTPEVALSGKGFTPLTGGRKTL